jgi:hypothetical protein
VASTLIFGRKQANSSRNNAADLPQPVRQSNPFHKGVSDRTCGWQPCRQEYAVEVDMGERSMRKTIVAALLTIGLAGSGTCFAQTTPGTTGQPSQTSPAPSSASHSTARVAQYKTEVDAKAHCGSDQVVWGNTRSHVLHDPGTKYYGKTTHGAYVCKGVAMNAGYHESQ